MRQNAAVCTNAQALWRQPQTNRTVRIERRENKTPKNKKKTPTPKPPPPEWEGEGRSPKVRECRRGVREATGEGGSGAWGRETAQQHLRGCRSRRRREGRGFSTRCRRRTKTVPNIPFPRRQTLRATDEKKTSKRRVFHSKTSPFFARIRALSFKTSRVFSSAFCRLDLPAFRFGGTARNA